MSNTLPWRTLVTPATPSDLSAPSIALPWGSRIPVLRVTVMRAFMSPHALGGAMRPQLWTFARFRCEFYARRSLMHRGRRLFEQPAAARHMATLADEPHCGPERGRRARDDRNTVAVLERPGDAERAQASAGNQDAIGTRRLGDRLTAQRNDVGFALA